MSTSSITVPVQLLEFLKCETPQAWIDTALENESILLIDHANCEKKAAATAMNLMYRYVDRCELLQKMSQLAREELLHFEQVVKIMQVKEVSYSHLSASRYASSLRQHIRSHEPARLTDTLIVGAFVEARSCERFAKLAARLDDDLKKFYVSLLRSEARHFEDYIALAGLYAGEDISERVAFFAEQEAELITSKDSQFRFHSGTPELTVQH
ncbi:MAG: tRNA isopentenyl-2-thiomethyl-A-37 hydroxylase MiaE [Gammaproteobacteria bacterium]|nr:tRNA isopentenyl-2-thiomethyl-A-37 hydroxylase MiaE [Gammaproteobacteria bacterium]